MFIRDTRIGSGGGGGDDVQWCRTFPALNVILQQRYCWLNFARHVLISLMACTTVGIVKIVVEESC